MKYVMFHKVIGSDTNYFVPIIFPNTLVHIEIADAMVAKGAPLEGFMPVSAGEISPLDMECYGESTTLKMRADGERDTRIIRMSDYGGGYG